MIVGYLPVLEPLSHHRGRDGEMKGGGAAFLKRPGIQPTFDRGRVINDAEPATAGEQAEVPRFLWRRWAVDEFHRICFHDAVGIADSKLMLIHEQPVRGRFSLEQSDRSFDSPKPANQRPGQEGYNSKVGDEKSDVMCFPGPAGEGRDGKVRR